MNAEIAGLMDEHVPPDDPHATEAAERQRLLIDASFYPCSHETHRGLGQMYVADPWFAANFEKIRPGFAQYLCNAIAASSAEHVGAVREHQDLRRQALEGSSPRVNCPPFR